jgi:hypothetical protein
MRRLLAQRLVGVAMALVMVGFSVTAAFADPRDFTLINATGRAIHQVYVGPSNQVDWGDDILGADILPDGATVGIKFQRFTQGDCLYDIKVVTEDGAEGELDQVNLCETDTVTFH